MQDGAIAEGEAVHDGEEVRAVRVEGEPARREVHRARQAELVDVDRHVAARRVDVDVGLVEGVPPRRDEALVAGDGDGGRIRARLVRSDGERSSSAKAFTW